MVEIMTDRMNVNVVYEVSGESHMLVLGEK